MGGVGKTENDGGGEFKINYKYLCESHNVPQYNNNMIIKKKKDAVVEQSVWQPSAERKENMIVLSLSLEH
jgi:hypothetical protein